MGTVDAVIRYQEQQQASVQTFVYFAEKATSLGKDWHKGCLKCKRCNKTLTPGGHAENDGNPYCHKPCYATLFGPSGTNSASHAEYTKQK